MSKAIQFALDANVFIEAARRYYAFDIAPGFWDSLIREGNNGHLLSIDRVKTELERGKDQLASWTKQQFADLFASTNEDVILKEYSTVMQWVQFQTQFSDAAKADFASGADGWLVAFCVTKQFVPVTQEQYNAETKRKVPIPNVCKAFNIQVVDTFEMLRLLEVKFN